MTYGRVFTDDAGPVPQHRWELVDASAPEGDPLVAFVGPEGFWARQAGLWEEAVIEQLGIRPDDLAWLRDGAPYSAVEMSLG